jgi:hypothetical protein
MSVSGSTAPTVVCVARYRVPVNPLLVFPSREDFYQEVQDPNHQGQFITQLVPYTYSVSPAIELSEATIPKRQAQVDPAQDPDYVFDFSANPIPGNVFDLELQVIYKGTVGQEQDAVAVGRVDVCEPQEICVFNDSDYFFLLDEPFLSVPNNDFDSDNEAETWYCRPFQRSFALTFYGPPVQGQTPPTPASQIQVTVESGFYHSYLILQDNPWYYVHEECPVQGEFPAVNREYPATGLRNQRYTVANEVIDPFGQAGNHFQEYDILNKLYKQRGKLCHVPFGAGTYGYLCQGRPIDAHQNLYMLHTDPWRLSPILTPYLQADLAGEYSAEPPFASSAPVPTFNIPEPVRKPEEIFP